jgi:hypothetical protein
MVMRATISVTCVVNNPQNIPPRLQTQQVKITVYKPSATPLPPPIGGGLNLEEVGDATTDMIAGHSSNAGFGVDDSAQYWIHAEIVNDKSGFFGDWNDTYDVEFGILYNGPFGVTAGQTTSVTLTGVLKVHQHI